LKKNELSIEIMSRGLACLDAGTYDSLLYVAGCIVMLQKRLGLIVLRPKEIAYRQSLISAETVQKVADQLSKSRYGPVLKKKH
jgi:glucose-1-phosphate thymidylyltransferase